MTKRHKTEFMDDYQALSRGMVAALRNKEHFMFLKELFAEMNDIQKGLDPTGPKNDQLFLFRNYKSAALAANWRIIAALYERGLAPIRVVTPPPEVSREEAETTQLRTALEVFFPPPDGAPEDIKAFASFFRTRLVEQLDSDFAECRASLETACLKLARFMTPDEVELNKSDPRLAMEQQDQRVHKVKSLFALGSIGSVGGGTEMMLGLLTDTSRTTRIPFLAGVDAMSMDAIIKGFHGRGLVVFLGATSAGKTLVMSSLVSNHVEVAVRAALKGQTAVPPTVWGYIGEDSIEEYVRRGLCNVLNRLRNDLGIQSFTLSEFSDLMTTDADFRAIAEAVMQSGFSNTDWIKSPERPEEKLKFTVISLLNQWDARLDAGAEKPSFVVIDYFNLLKLPKYDAPSSRAEELSTIAHILDEWGQQRGITVITAVQASIEGVKGTRDLRFLDQEDLHECKSIQHHSRMMISMLPIEQWNPDGSKTDWMGFKFLKNRGGQKGMHFLCSLDYARNMVFIDSKFYSDVEWNQHKANILSRRAEIFGTELHGGATPIRGGGGQGGGRGGGGGGPRRHPAGQGIREAFGAKKPPARPMGGEGGTSDAATTPGGAKVDNGSI